LVRKEILYSGDSNNNAVKPSLMEEPRKFAEAFCRHWPLVLSIGLFFGWLLSFPMQGPLFRALVQDRDVSPVLLITLYLFGHILGFAIAGITGYFFRRKLVWLSPAAILCAVISGGLSWIAADYWWLLFTLMGLFSGISIISWGNAFVSSVPPARRGRTFALAAVLSNLVLYLATIPTAIAPIIALMRRPIRSARNPARNKKRM